MLRNVSRASSSALAFFYVRRDPALRPEGPAAVAGENPVERVAGPERDKDPSIVGDTDRGLLGAGE